MHFQPHQSALVLASALTVGSFVGLVVANVLADRAESPREKGIEVVADGCERIEVACSVGVLTSVIENLATNAIRYMGDGPAKRLTVRARGSEGRARIEVADTGPGIRPIAVEVQARTGRWAAARSRRSSSAVRRGP